MIGFNLTIFVIETQWRFPVIYCFSEKRCCDGSLEFRQSRRERQSLTYFCRISTLLIYSVIVTAKGLFQKILLNTIAYILIHKFITIKDDGLNIDIVKILLLWNVLSVYKNVFESSQGGTFKLANPKHEHRTERQSGRLSQS